MLNTNFCFFKLVWMQGFVISDWQGIDRITSPPHSNYTYSVLAGVQAGIDMVQYLSFAEKSVLLSTIVGLRLTTSIKCNLILCEVIFGL